MKLAIGLHKEGSQWRLAGVTSFDPELTGGGPDAALQLTMRFPGEDKEYRHVFHKSFFERMEETLFLGLRRFKPEHRLVAEYLKDRGHVPVVWVTPARENIGEAVHTALRKLADSKQSVITYNAVHALAPEDWSEACAAIHGALTKAFEEELTPLRINVAKKVQKALIDKLEVIGYRPLGGREGEQGERTQLQTLALRSLQAGCALTEIEEWMWGWLGFVLEDVPRAKLTQETTQSA